MDDLDRYLQDQEDLERALFEEEDQGDNRPKTETYKDEF